MWDVPEGRVVPGYVKVIDEGLESIIERCHRKIEELQPIETEEKFDRRMGVIGLDGDGVLSGSRLRMVVGRIKTD